MPKSPERCQEIRQEMRSKILHESMLYFAKNGFSGTKISDLSQYIGIAQGTIYVYFQSKEDLFQEIFSIVNNPVFVFSILIIFSFVNSSLLARWR